MCVTLFTIIYIQTDHRQGSHSTIKTMKMELNHENHEKTMKIRICQQKNMKTEISGQNFRLRRAIFSHNFENRDFWSNFENRDS